MHKDQMNTPNILFIIADDLREMSVNSERMPFSYDFFDIRFKNCFAPSTWTLPSHASLFSGKNPIEHGITRKSQSLGINSARLPEEAQKAGYRTALLSENPFFSSYRGFDNKIDYVDDQINYKIKPSTFSIANHADDPAKATRVLMSRLMAGESRRNDIVNSLYAVYKQYLSEDSDSNVGSAHKTIRMISHLQHYWRKINTTSVPTLTFVNLLETHNPHTVVQSSANELGIKFTDKEITALNRPDDDHEFLFGQTSVRDPFESWEELYQKKQDAYHTSIHYLDSLLKSFFTRCEDINIRNSIIIFTGDHGEMFGEGGMVGHQTSLHPAGIKVPLFIKFPNKWGGHRSSVDTPVNWLGVSRVLEDIVKGRLSDPESFIKELIYHSTNRESDSLICTVDGPNWNIDQLKHRYDAESVSDLLEVRRIGLINDDKMTVYSSNWGDKEVRECQYRLEDNDRTLIDRRINKPNIEKFSNWLTNADSSSVSEDVSQRLKDLGYA